MYDDIDKEISDRLKRSMDPRWPLLRAARLGGIGLAALTVISAIVWTGGAGMPGLWGVLIGAAVGGGFVLLTVFTVLLTSNTTPTNTMTVVLGSWLVKIVVLLMVMAALKSMTFYDRNAFVVTVILALIVVLGSETWGIMTSRVTYLADIAPEDSTKDDTD